MIVENNRIKIYFRIPFTIYFVGRTKPENEWSPLKILTKRFEKGKYYWNVIK
jgi:hypothetical protein